MKRSILVALVATAAVTAAAGGQSAAADSGSRVRQVAMQDDCDPTTFNAALGEGACVGDGDTTFDELVQSLLAGDPDGHWRNHPDELRVRAGEDLVVTNEGGEFHTFTEVPAFGAGCVPDINALMGLAGPPVADCPAAFGDPATALPPGATGTLHTHDMTPGMHLFMCVIHPWMQAEVQVRRR